ncbi:MAG: Ig-like domain-containing protein, partial [Cyanobacteria bacterium J06626_26]
VGPDNQDPTPVDDAFTLLAGEAFTGNVTANDSDPDGDNLTATIVNETGNGAVTFDNGDFTYTPNDGFSGTDSFTYEVDDGNGGTAQATVTLTVEEAEPTLETLNFVFRVPAGSLFAGETGDVSFTYDPSGIPPTGVVNIPLESVELNLAGETLTLADDADGANVQFENGEFNGSDFATTNVPATPNIFTLAFEVGANGPDFGSFVLLDNDFNQVSVLFDTELGNTAPVAQPDAVTTAAGESVTVDVLSNDSDVEGDTLIVDSVGEAANGAVVLNDDGTVTYTPNEDFTDGLDTFTYVITDGEFTSQTSVEVTVEAAANAAPAATDDSANTGAGEAITVDVLGNDTDPDGDALTVDSVGEAANGTAVLNDDGTVTYTPNDGFTGDDSFTYTISDGNDGTSTATVTVSVAAPPNAEPDAVDDSANAESGQAVTINVLGNDTDADGDNVSVDS